MSEDMIRLSQHVQAHMRRGTVRNYICPGLRSSMIAENPDGSCVRIFEADRDTREFPITPHSHGYAFSALVLEGGVINTLYNPEGSEGFRYSEASIALYVPGFLQGMMGEYSIDRPKADPVRYYLDDTPYSAGETYSMGPDEVHSIQFYAGAKVLMFCGPRLADRTMFLEPWVDGYGRVPLFETKSWMYQK